MTVVDAAGAADTITVSGTAGADAFTLTNSAVSTAAETVNYTSAGIETLAVNGLAGDDTFTVSALTRAATVDGGAGQRHDHRDQRRGEHHADQHDA